MRRYYPLTKAPKNYHEKTQQGLFIPAEPKQARIIESVSTKPKHKRFHKKKSKSPLAGQ